MQYFSNRMHLSLKPPL